MPPRETGKQRAARIPLDYYKRPNRIERLKVGLAAAALVASVGVAGAAWLFRDGGRPYVSRGPVASVHAAWDSKCEACHADFRPMSKGAVTAALFGSPGSHDSTVNQRCEQCHDGTAHHASQLDALTPACGGCHRDHRGREASLVVLPDADCTQCHENLAASVKEGKPGYESPVTSFATQHPDFRSLKSDPGRLKFNHRLHMTPGQVIDPGQVNPWTLDKLKDPAVRERYKNAPWQSDKADGAPVVLDCASCHRLDAGDFTADVARNPGSAAPEAFRPRAAGAYMLPVNYEAHCSACHPLTFDANVKGKDGKPVSVPHRLQPDEVRSFVWGAYAEAYLHQGLDQRVAEALKAGPHPSRPLPGKLTEEEQAARDAVGTNTAQADRFLFKADVSRADGYLTSGRTACGECHEYAEAGGTKRVLPPQVNEVWLTHAKFSHVAHRAADCRLCHENAYADGRDASTSAKDVLIAGLKSCRECHSPAGGVRSDCTECHSYHNGDRPLQGLGAAARDPHSGGQVKRFGKVEEFLGGARE